MRAPRKAVNTAVQLRLDLQAERGKSPLLRDLMPTAEVIHLEMSFAEFFPLPSAQLHSLYPSARAFFRFACPCTDCDGDFDLSDEVARLAKPGASSKRAAERTANGHRRCAGVLWRNGKHSKACTIEMTYRIAFRSAAA